MKRVAVVGFAMATGVVPSSPASAWLKRAAGVTATIADHYGEERPVCQERTEACWAGTGARTSW